MNWILLPIIATFLWASTNFIDKYLISKYFKTGPGVLVLYSCFIGLPVSVFILLFNREVLSISFSNALFIILNSFLYIAYLFPYFSALNKADTSNVTPIFQTIPVFTYFLALIFLGENLEFIQIFACLLILCGSFGVSLNFKKGFVIRKKVFGLMLLSSFLVSLNWLFFKFFALDLDFWKVSFWQYLGFFIFGLVLFILNKSYRFSFISSLYENKLKIFSLNAFNEIFNIIAIIIFSYATLLAPLALVSVMNGFQPFFILFLGIILSMFFPHLIKEELSKRILVYKLLFILLIFLGVLLLQRSF